MSGTSVIKPTPPQDLLVELRNFVSGATHSSKVSSQELSRTAIFLLKNLPAARDAVLEYLSTIFDVAINKYLAQIEEDANHSSEKDAEDAILADIHGVLSSFISSNPEAWAPIISAWCLELLGQLSSRYAGRAHVPHSAGLNDMLQLWMSCCATRTLIDITTQCLSCLIHSNTDACISALLDTSVQHSPHFDWVVAHIGGCFPQTVITRVLSCGLRDFCHHGSQQGDGCGSVTQEHMLKVPKLNSVVGILGHLAGSHAADIRKALLNLFQWSLTEPPNTEQLATVPFLLHLASMSSMLLKALTTDVLRTLTPETLNSLSRQVPQWSSRFFPSNEALISLVVHLALGSEHGGAQIVTLLLDSASPENSLPIKVKATCAEIMELLLLELAQLIHSTTRHRAEEIPIMSSLHKALPSLWPLLLSPEQFRAQCFTRLLGLLALYHGKSVTSDAISYLLKNASTNSQLGVMIELLKSVEQMHTTACKEAIHFVLHSRDSEDISAFKAVLKNLNSLLKWEMQNEKVNVIRSKVIVAVEENLDILAEQLLVREFAHLAMEVIINSHQPECIAVSLLSKLCHTVVSYYFLALEETDTVVKIRGCKRSSKYLTSLCNHSAAQTLSLRLLLEGAVLSDYSKLLGAKHTTRPPTREVSIFSENQKLGACVTLPQRHSTVFHAGVIGSGLRNNPPVTAIPKEKVALNCRLLIEAIQLCCVPSRRYQEERLSASAVPPPEGMTVLSLLMVEIISPDVMFNGLPWPEEDFTKVTLERDLQIKRTLDENLVVWDILRLIASHRPALCYCSVILRAIAATMLAHWSSSQEKKASNSPTQLATTAKLLDVMALGQLLPPPLAHISEILEFLTPHEVQLLMHDVWSYMRENVPSPALFTKDESDVVWREFPDKKAEKHYWERLRLIFQSNMDKIGHMYPRFFDVTEVQEPVDMEVEEVK